MAPKRVPLSIPGVGFLKFGWELAILTAKYSVLGATGAEISTKFIIATQPIDFLNLGKSNIPTTATIPNNERLTVTATTRTYKHHSGGEEGDSSCGEQEGVNDEVKDRAILEDILCSTACRSSDGSTPSSKEKGGGALGKEAGTACKGP